MTMDRRILVGVVGAPHGVRGEMRLKSFTEVPTAIGRYRPLLSEDGRQSFTILAVRPVKDDMVVARFEGVADREAAAALTNTRLYVERSQLPPAEEEEFYHADLIGLRAETAAGVDLGRITAVLNFGAGDLLEIQPAEGETRLVAFTKAFVPVIDLPGRRVVVDESALAAEEPDDGPASGDEDAG
jgi:16S rRNA processing protein RimM